MFDLTDGERERVLSVTMGSGYFHIDILNDLLNMELYFESKSYRKKIVEQVQGWVHAFNYANNSPSKTLHEFMIKFAPDKPNFMMKIVITCLKSDKLDPFHLKALRRFMTYLSVDQVNQEYDAVMLCLSLGDNDIKGIALNTLPVLMAGFSHEQCRHMFKVVSSCCLDPFPKVVTITVLPALMPY